MTVVYLRVSSDEQARDAYGIESQLFAISEFCKKRGWVIVKVFSDPGASGWKDLDCPEFMAMLRFLRDSPNHNLIFYDYSRFYRRTALATLEFEKLDDLGIYSASVCNPLIDCRTAGGRTERRRLLSEAEDSAMPILKKQQDRMKAPSSIVIVFLASLPSDTRTSVPAKGSRTSFLMSQHFFCCGKLTYWWKWVRCVPANVCAKWRCAV